MAVYACQRLLGRTAVDQKMVVYASQRLLKPSVMDEKTLEIQVLFLYLGSSLVSKSPKY
jgi:hypothetical protein